MRKGLEKYWPFAAVLILIVLLGIYKLFVIDVVWEGINPDETTAWKVTELPENATQVRETESQSELLRQAMFLVVPLIVVAIVYLVVGKKKNLIQPDKKALIVGMAASFLSQPLHELIHVRYILELLKATFPDMPRQMHI
jgi:membrane protein YdbS with pleckstrin-like domain